MIVAEPRRVPGRCGRRSLFLSTKPVIVVPTLVATAPPVAPARAPATASGAAHGHAPASAPASVPTPTPAARRTRSAGAWALATPWVMGIVLLLSAYLAWFTVDLLQNRLHESSLKFDANVHRFERFWTLHDAAMESTLAVKWDLATAAPAAARRGAAGRCLALRAE